MDQPRLQFENEAEMRARELDVAYLSGIIDGEGSFFLASRASNNLYMPVLKIQMNDKRVIDWIHKNFGGVVDRYSRPDLKNTESGYAWRARSISHLRQLIPELIPFLIVKKLQAATLLEFVQTFNAGHRRGGLRLGYTEEEKQRMHAYAKFLKELNSRGPGSNDRKAALYAIAEREGKILEYKL